jgi:DNA-binding NarL/FixJ family response regulator
VVAAVRDLFFSTRIRETARLVGTRATVARTTPDALAAAADAAAALLVIDLTDTAMDHAAVLGAAAARQPRLPVLGYTTHVLARTTQPLHARCDRVLTKEALTRELAAILRDGLAAAPAEELAR